MSENKAVMQKNERAYLKDILPLEQPLSLNLEVTNACNAKCRYCVHSLETDAQKKIGLMPVSFMTDETFENVMRALRELEHPIKSIRFAGFGEPTLHKELASMINKIKQEKLSQKIILFTNAFNLNPKLSLELIEAGVDNFQIDIQGLSEEDYIQNCRLKINFDEMKANIKYLYEHKGDAIVYVRTLRFEVAGREKVFYETFSGIADYLAIDSTCRISDEIDYSDMISEEDMKTDEENVFSQYCPQPFFQLTINVDGGVAACCGAIERSNNTLMIGNINKSTIRELWNGDNINKVRNIVLTDKHMLQSCRTCHIKDIISKYDVLDDAVDRLKKMYEEV